MERRILLALLLCFVVLYGYQAYVVPKPPPAAAKPAAAATPDAESPQTASAPSTASPVAAPVAATVALTTGEPAEREIVVETATVQAVFTNRGARVLHWRLKNYLDSKGQPVDLVPSALPATQPTPFSLRVRDREITERLNTALYRVTGVTGNAVDATRTGATVVFEMQDAAGLQVRKAFRFEPTNYVVGLSTRVTVNGSELNPRVQWGPGLGDEGAAAGGGSIFTGNVVQPPRTVYYRDGKMVRLATTKLAESPAHGGTFKFAGIDDHYFMAAVVNGGEGVVEYRDVVLGTDDNKRHLIAPTFRFNQLPEEIRFFVGPKQFDVLRAVDPDLVRAIDYTFAVLVLPLLQSLKWIHGIVGNYGASIVLLTLLVNLVMALPRHWTIMSSRRMQVIQPRLKTIQDRYAHLKATDPEKQKMQSEIWAVYKEAGANPISGCVPMLLTMPVLFAFYSLLQYTVELRGAPFGLWIHDLSRHDPYYVTPILMAVTMWWQQRSMPTAMDPQQQKMMMMMPLMFGFMFLQLPSGLAIYYLISNVFQIAQQFLTNRFVPLTAPTGGRSGGSSARGMKAAGAGRTAAAERKG